MKLNPLFLFPGRCFPQDNSNRTFDSYISEAHEMGLSRGSVMGFGLEPESHDAKILIATRIWGSENPHAVQEVERNSPKINAWCALLHDTVIGPFFFAETSVTANIYLDMLQSYAIPQMQHLQPIDIFQQDALARLFEHFAGTELPAGYPQGY
ncbi:hypothetical protein AVEN_157499-1 [Araneus ventricosus]|uniref:Uncharacterized protein n=1 Tax=Araneus ventricosus TaxID=182803 RepID=A0A4Y2GX67_ARAVE|nr:hypothetical protein AVEN_157499-1 [Araneus ventricosus]